MEEKPKRPSFAYSKFISADHSISCTIFTDCYHIKERKKLYKYSII